MDAFTENVITISDNGKIIGFISRGSVYGCHKLDSEQIAKLIDPEFGTISRTVKSASVADI